ncbi:MAG: hypothetical protein MR051_01800 [Lentisphaeria bacterium]|nr:hypothetical protein [Lentisphaeria bacterium]
MRKILPLILLSLTAAGGELADVAQYRMDFVGARTRLFREGRELDFAACLREQLRLHPAMRPADAVKLCTQASRGPEHLLAEPKRAEAAFHREFAAVPVSDGPLFEVIGPDFCRINLGAWKRASLPEAWLWRMALASAQSWPDGDAVFREYLRTAETVLTGKARTVFREYLAGYRGGAVHHSPEYHAAEHPSYRVVSTRLLPLLPVLKRAAALPERPVRVIAVDGRAASGKTTLAKQLGGVLAAPVVHMDDFFLPLALRKPERFAEPGGNVHYERFIAEVLPFLRSGSSFSYRVFDCSIKDFRGERAVAAAPWRIVEGAYSLHPKFGEYADLKIFYDIAPEEQMRRIRRRNGDAAARVFAERWIPFEERYIRAAKVRERADLILGAAIQ